MTIDGDVTVGGAARMSTELSQGVLRVTGDFTSTSTTKAWRPSGTLVRFEGTSSVGFLQSGASGSGFRDVEVAPGARVTFTSDVHAAGTVTVDGTLVNTAGGTTTIVGDLTVNTGGTLDNPGTVVVGGTYTNAGTLIGNAPM